MKNFETNNEKVKEIVNAIGSLGEMCGIFLASLLKNGFTREEAIFLVQHYMSTTLSGGFRNNQEDE